MKTIEDFEKLERENVELKKKVRQMDAEEIKALGLKYEKAFRMSMSLSLYPIVGIPWVSIGRTSVPITIEIKLLQDVMVTETCVIMSKIEQFLNGESEDLAKSELDRLGRIHFTPIIKTL